MRLKEISEYRELLWNLVLTELKLRYRDSLLGFLWTVLNPLFSLLILSFVFSRIIRFENLPHYTIFLFSGLTSWFMIQQTAVIAIGSVVNNQSLIKKIYVPKIVFPLSNVLARYVDHGILLGLLLVFMPIFGVKMGWSLLFLPVAVVLHFAFGLGLSLLLATAQVKVRDVQNAAGILFQAFFYLTPIIYPLEVLPRTAAADFRMESVLFVRPADSGAGVGGDAAGVGNRGGRGRDRGRDAGLGVVGLFAPGEIFCLRLLLKSGRNLW